MKIIAMGAHIMDMEFMTGGLSVKYFTFGHEIKLISLTGNKKDPFKEKSYFLIIHWGGGWHSTHRKAHFLILEIHIKDSLSPWLGFMDWKLE